MLRTAKGHSTAATSHKGVREGEKKKKGRTVRKIDGNTADQVENQAQTMGSFQFITICSLNS